VPVARLLLGSPLSVTAGANTLPRLLKTNPADEQVLKQLAAGDPTPNHKWLERMYQFVKREGADPAKVIALAHEFDRYSAAISTIVSTRNIGAPVSPDLAKAHPDFASYATLKDLETVITALKANKTQPKLRKQDARYTSVAKTKDLEIFKIENKEASCVLGSDSDWCSSKWDQDWYASRLKEYGGDVYIARFTDGRAYMVRVKNGRMLTAFDKRDVNRLNTSDEGLAQVSAQLTGLNILTDQTAANARISEIAKLITERMYGSDSGAGGPDAERQAYILKDATAWVSCGFIPEEVKAWLDVGVTHAQTAEELDNARVTPEMVATAPRKENSRISQYPAFEILEAIHGIKVFGATAMVPGTVGPNGPVPARERAIATGKPKQKYEDFIASLKAATAGRGYPPMTIWEGFIRRPLGAMSWDGFATATNKVKIGDLMPDAKVASDGHRAALGPVLAAEGDPDEYDLGRAEYESEQDLPPVWPLPEPKREGVPVAPLTPQGGVENILKVLAAAEAGERDYWGKWYHHAKDDVAMMAAHYGLEFETVAAIVAVLSPGNKWASNVGAADAVLSGHTQVAAYPANIAKAKKILATGDTSIVTGPKVTVFFRSLVDPTSVENEMVLDGHAINIWRGERRPLKGQVSPTKSERAQMLADYAEAAKRSGMTIQGVQALTWYCWKYAEGAGKKHASDLHVRLPLGYTAADEDDGKPTFKPLTESSEADLKMEGVDTDQLIKLIREHLDPKSLKKKYRDAIEFGGAHPHTGHAYGATEALYHLLGGRKSGYQPCLVRHEGHHHWFLKHPESGEVLDPANEHFETKPNYDAGSVRGFMTGDIPSAKAYDLVRKVRRAKRSLSRSQAEPEPATEKTDAPVKKTESTETPAPEAANDAPAPAAPAAEEFLPKAARIALLREGDVSGSSVVIVARAPHDLARAWPKGREGHDESPPHATVLYVGGDDENDAPLAPEVIRSIVNVVREVAASTEPYDMRMKPGVSWFENGAGDSIAHKGFAPDSVSWLAKLHHRLNDECEALGVKVKHFKDDDGFKAHATLAYLTERAWDPELGKVPEGVWPVEALEIWGVEGPDASFVFPLTGKGDENENQSIEDEIMAVAAALDAELAQFTRRATDRPGRVSLGAPVQMNRQASGTELMQLAQWVFTNPNVFSFAMKSIPALAKFWPRVKYKQVRPEDISMLVHELGPELLEVFSEPAAFGPARNRVSL